MIPLHIHPFFWLLALGIGWLNSGTFHGTLIFAAVIFFSVLFHEYGHALTARAFGQKARIDLLPFGGLTTRNGPPLALWKDFIITANGPLVGFAIGFGAWFLFMHTDSSTSPLLAYVLRVTFSVNIFWTVLNLLPIHPLDGGQLLRIMMEGAFGMTGLKIALFLSMLAAAAIALLAFLYSQFLIGAFMFLLAVESWRSWQDSLVLTPQDRDEELKALLERGEAELQNRQEDAALDTFNHVRSRAGEGALHNAATWYLADILARRGRFADAYRLLEPVENALTADIIPLYHKLAWKSGHYDTAARFGDQAYRSHPSYEVALINSLAFATLNDETPAIGWLKRAISDGLPDPRAAADDKAFDGIRHTPSFQKIIN